MLYMNRVSHNTRQTCVSAQGEGNILLIKIVYILFKARGEKSFIKRPYKKQIPTERGSQRELVVQRVLWGA